MKFILTFKTPDVISQIDGILFDDEEIDDEALEDMRYDVETFLENYVENSEYVRIEFDSLNNTATVLKRKN